MQLLLRLCNHAKTAPRGHARSQTRHVEIDPDLVTSDNQVTFDPQRLVSRRYPENCPDGSPTSAISKALLRMSWRTPDLISPSSPRMTLPGVTRLVTHPSVALARQQNRPSRRRQERLPEVVLLIRARTTLIWLARPQDLHVRHDADVA